VARVKLDFIHAGIKVSVCTIIALLHATEILIENIIYKFTLSHSFGQSDKNLKKTTNCYEIKPMDMATERIKQ
jgi:hypothetical protein